MLLFLLAVNSGPNEGWEKLLPPRGDHPSGQGGSLSETKNSRISTEGGARFKNTT